MTPHFLKLQVASLVFAWLTVITGAVFTQAESVPIDIATLEHQVHKLVNAHRTSRGLEPLNYSEDVAVVARRHSHDMAKGVVGMGHEGAERRRTALAKIITYTQLAENVGVNNASVTSTAQAVVTAWLSSPGHRANIEKEVDLTGIGVARSGATFFFTQLFLTTRSSSHSFRETHRSRDHAPVQTYSPAHKRDEPRLRDGRGDTPSRRRDEVDPRKRAGRKRVGVGWVQELDKGR